jgi:hypothetical protein
VPILLYSSVPSTRRGAFPRRGGSHGGFPTIYWTDADGRFVVPGRPGHLSWQLSTFLCGEDAGNLPRSRHAPLHSRLVIASGWDDPGKDQDVGTLVLADYVPLDVEVVDESGSPAPGTRVYFREQPSGQVGAGNERVCSAATDWAGRLRVLCRPGVTMLLRTTSESRAPEVEAAIGKDPAKPGKIRLSKTEAGGR